MMLNRVSIQKDRLLEVTDTVNSFAGTHLRLMKVRIVIAGATGEPWKQNTPHHDDDRAAVKSCFGLCLMLGSIKRPTTTTCIQHKAQLRY